MADPTVRIQLEEAIIQASRRVKMSLQSTAWINSSELSQLLNAWYALLAYYQSNNDDLVISVEVLREYLNPTRLLRKLLLFDLEDTQKERVEEILAEFERILESIITEVVTFLNDADDSR